MSKRHGFTLIELLVVIAIIAILAAILFPVFAKARAKARQTACLSNARQIATAFLQYNQDYDEMWPSSYYYKNKVPGGTGSSANGYVQWSGMIQPYVKNDQLFVCPEHTVRGWAPTCFTYEWIPNPPAGQTPLRLINDLQVPRLSYVANEAILPRMKYDAIPCRVIPDSIIEAPSETIVTAEYTNNIQQLLDSSPTGGDAIKSHRPTNAVSANGGVFDGESYVVGTPIIALTPQACANAFAASYASSAMGQHHICYTNPEMHNAGANYVLCDGHAKWYRLENTLNPDSFLWGKRMHTCPDNPTVLRPDGTGPVD